MTNVVKSLAHEQQKFSFAQIINQKQYSQCRHFSFDVIVCGFLLLNETESPETILANCVQQKTMTGGYIVFTKEKSHVIRAQSNEFSVNQLQKYRIFQ